MLLFATSKDIRIANLSRPLKPVTIIKDLEEGAAIDYYYKKSMVCWTDHGTEMISCCTFDGNNVGSKHNVITNGLITPDGLAIDWLTEKLYWTDSETNKLEVSSLDGKKRKVLYWEDIDQPRAIASYKVLAKEAKPLTCISPVQIPGNPIDSYAIWMFHFYGYHILLSCTVQLDPTYGFILKVAQHSKTFHNCCETFHIPGLIVSPVQMLLHGVPVYGDRVFDSHHWQHYIRVVRSVQGDLTDVCVRLVDNFTCANGSQEVLLLVLLVLVMGFRPPLGDKLPTIEVEHPDGVAVDWVARNLYWTDTGTDRIEVCRLEGTHRKVLVNTDLVEPRAITLSPAHGYLFWSDWNEKRPKIERSLLNGGERVLLVKDRLGWPNGITLDVDNEKLYWCDAKTDKIEMIDFDGNNRRELINENLPHVFGISLLGDYVYWTDWQRRSIDRVNKITGNDREVIIEPLANIMGLKAIGNSYPQVSNPCARANGNCSHLCFYLGSGAFKCACQIGYELSPRDNRTCFIPEAFLVMSRSDSILRGSTDNDVNNALIPLNSIREIRSIDAWIGRNEIYWADSKAKSIARANINGSNYERLVDFGIQSVESVCVDWLALNLYWSDTFYKRIEVTRLSAAPYRRVLIWNNLYEPRSICLIPALGLMLWSDWGAGNGGTIERSALDGTQRSVLLHKVKANSLTVNYDEKRVYYVNLLSSSIESIDIEGRNKITIVANIEDKPVTLTLYKSEIFYSNWDKRSIEKYDKTSHTRSVIYRSSEKEINDMLIYHPSRQTGWNKCAVANNECDYLCLATPGRGGGLNYKCECPTHYTMVNGTCMAPSSFLIRRQTGWNKCAVANNECDYLCLATPGRGGGLNYKCECPTHYTMLNGTCMAPSSFLIYAQRNILSRLITDPTQCPDSPYEIPNVKNIKALDYDPVARQIYWIDSKLQAIKRASENASGVEIFYNTASYTTFQILFDLVIDVYNYVLFYTCANTNVIYGIKMSNKSEQYIVFKGGEGVKPRHISLHETVARQIYWIDSKLQAIKRASENATGVEIFYNTASYTTFQILFDLVIDVYNYVLFYTCANTNVIYGIKMSNKSEQYIVFKGGEGVKPRHISLHEDKGLLFWSDLNEKHNIVRCRVDGQKKLIIAGDLLHVTSVTVDKELNNVYFSYNGVVEMTDLNGNNRQVLIKTNLKHVASLTIHGPNLLYLDKEEQIIESIHKLNASNRHIILSHVPHLIDLVHVGQVNKNHVCYNNPCSHYCLPVNNKPQCACPHELNLHENLKSCLKLAACTPEQYKCATDECIPAVWRCDNQADCADKSDETGCVAKCDISEFRCGSGECVNAKLRCDGGSQCVDGSDEVNCCAQASSFQCTSGQCILSSFICDGKLHCTDGSDEDTAACALSPQNHHLDPNAVDINPSLNIITSLGVFVVTFSFMLFLYYNFRYKKTSSCPPPTNIALTQQPLCHVIPPPRLTSLPPSSSSSYQHQSSTSLLCYPPNPPPSPPTPVQREPSTPLLCYPLTPPPPPATTVQRDEYCCPRYQPPPPTPCSTDVCDESDCNYDPYPPPPPTPTSHSELNSSSSNSSYSSYRT
ncbi:LOW QUALITY PROTEIN: low-density lipoprotein receptor-related protein 6 [Diaphorina citri]|uniref:LOW QUALITY PROTEIN: low-density lipoprotein receptor-related protein 6 n=1 Tax=Diaphorina citri TaxID=121845 RepID=A0A3Q0IZA2_DIACI|nr:LOW QUALITY PROTEIN: low-density lipoprotein receptor-related protein 6 [Diaphorina citri]